MRSRSLGGLVSLLGASLLSGCSLNQAPERAYPVRSNHYFYPQEQPGRQLLINDESEERLLQLVERGYEGVACIYGPGGLPGRGNLVVTFADTAEIRPDGKDSGVFCDMHKSRRPWIAVGFFPNTPERLTEYFYKDTGKIYFVLAKGEEENTLEVLVKEKADPELVSSAIIAAE